MLEAGIVLFRFLHYVTALTLFGISLFPLYTYPTRADRPPPQAKRLLQLTVPAAAFAALLSGFLWFVLVVANMTGTPGGMLDRDTLWSVLTETNFGKVAI